MTIIFHPHALERMSERGTTKKEVKATFKNGEQFSAKYGRTGFRRNFPFEAKWRGKHYNTKQVEVYTIQDGSDWLVITVITRFF